jgi:hypothetical protein
MDHIEWANRYLCKQWINTDDTLHAIIDAIQNNKPLSYTRYGDGDLILLKEYFNLIHGNPYYINLCNANHHIPNIEGFFYLSNNLEQYASMRHNEMITEHFERRWGIFDKDLQNHITLTIGQSLLFALQNSSHNGIWSIKDQVLCSGIDEFYLYRHTYVPHIELFAECGVNFSSLCDGYITKKSEMLANPYEFKKILNGKPIHIFTSNEYELTHITKLNELLETNITYTNLTPIKGDYKSFSFMHHDFLHEECKNIKSQIILYGLGYGAKHIPSLLSTKYGKTVIDVGAMLDGWAGKITRPYIQESNFMVPSHVNTQSPTWIA